MNMPVSSERKRSKAGCVSQKKVLIALVLMLVVCGSSLLFGDDVTDAVRLNRGRPFYDYASGQTYTTVSLQNTSSEPVSAPIKLVVTSISTLLVSVSDPDGTTPDGAPYLDFSSELGDQVLSPAETSANRTLRFDNADRQRFSFAWRIVTEAATPAHPPELGPVEDAVMEEGQSLEIPVTATDPDGDVVALRVAPLPAFASFIDHGNNAGTLALAPGYEDAGAYTLVCTAEDPGGLTDTGELEVTVQHVNRPPTADDQDITTDEDAATEIMLTGHDPDQDDLIFIIVEQPVKGVLTGEAPGLVYTPAAEFSGEDGFIFKVNDGTVDSDVARVTIRVDAVADPPIADAGADQRAFIGEEVTLNGSASHDPEGAPLRYHWTLLRAPTGSAATLRDAATAAPSLDIDRHGTYEAQLVVDDWEQPSTPDTVMVTTENRPPITHDQQVVCHLGHTLDVLLTGSDVDGDALVFSIVDDPVHVTLTGTPPHVSLIPEDGFLGEDGFTFEVDDGYGGTAIGTVSIAHTDRNQDPIITSMPLTTAGVGYEYVYPVVAVDPDGDALAYALLDGPDGMVVESDGAVRWVPAAEQAGDIGITVQAADGYGGSDSQTYWIRLTTELAANGPPSAHAGEDFTVEEGAEVALDGSHSNDPEEDHLRFLWVQVEGPEVELDNPFAGRPSFTAPEVDGNTLLAFELTVFDGESYSAADRVNVMVLEMDVNRNGMVVNSNLEGPGSLKAAIEFANANPGTRITFNIPDTDPGYGVNTPGVWTLPTPQMWTTEHGHRGGIRIVGDGTLLDGTSQAENWGDTNPYGPEIEIDQSTIAPWYPLQVKADNVTLRGLVLNKTRIAYAAIAIQGGDNISIVGNYIGTDATGTPDQYGDTGPGEGEEAVTVFFGGGEDKAPVRNLRIGGTASGEGNVIARYDQSGIEIDVPGISTIGSEPVPVDVTIQGNLMGVGRDGSMVSAEAGGVGVRIENPDAHVLVGGTTPGSRNVIAGFREGVACTISRFGFGTGRVLVQGNYIGTDVHGATTLNGPGMTGHTMGIYLDIDNEAAFNMTDAILIGGRATGAGNVIAGFVDGIFVNPGVFNLGAAHLQGNLIGTDATGTYAIPNSRHGIHLYVGSWVQIDDNVISGNGEWGIYSVNQTPVPRAVIRGNLIGVGIDGVTPIPNAGGGIRVGARCRPNIGGTAAGEGNTIAHNGGPGIFMPKYKDVPRRPRPMIRGNAIHGNANLGIARDLSADVVMLNDDGDANLAAHEYLQNFPEIATVHATDGSTLVRGALDTHEPEDCLVELFANTARDPCLYGEGERWLTALVPQPDGSFACTVPENLAATWITATAVRTVPGSDPDYAIRTSSGFSKAKWGGAVDPEANLPPVISSSPVTSVTVEDTYACQVTAADPEGDDVSYALALAPDGMSIDADGQISWQTTPGDEGRHGVTVIARDGQGLYGAQSFVVTVLEMIDTSPPFVTVASVAEQDFRIPTGLRGTVQDAYLVGYAVEVAMDGTDRWIPVGEGGENVIDDTIATLDPTRLANGLYKLRVTAYDETGNLTVYDHPELLDVAGKLKIGRFSLGFQDITVPVSGIPITVQRFYNSFDKRKGDFGVGWNMALGAGVRVDVTRTLGDDWYAEEDRWWVNTWVYRLVNGGGAAKVLITFADGRQDRFAFEPHFVADPAIDPRYVRVAYTPLDGTTSTLEAIGEQELILFPWPADTLGNRLVESDFATVYNPQRFRLTQSDGTVLILSQSAGLESITDPNGNRVTFGPEGIAHSAGIAIDTERDAGGRITRVADPMGYDVEYHYDEHGDLVGFEDQEGGLTQYVYDDAHNLVEIYDPTGAQVLETAYDAEGRMVGTVDGRGYATAMVHDPENAREFITDRNGNTTMYEYDNDGNVVAVTDPQGHVTSYTYDERGNKLSEIDALGNTAVWTYDEHNNMLSETDPLGFTQRWTYGAMDRLLSATDAKGNTTTYEYDGAGNLLKKTDPLGNTVAYSYDGAGNQISKTDCNGHTWTYAYDAAGNQTLEIDPLGHETVYTYDGNGNRIAKTTSRTTPSGIELMTWETVYDRRGLAVMQVDPDGNATTAAYDENGKKVGETDKLGHVKEYTYDGAGNLTVTLFPDGTQERYGYDGNGNRTSQTDRAGQTTSFEFEDVVHGAGEPGARNRLSAIVNPDGTRKTFHYDVAGRLTLTLDENGNGTSNRYDAVGNIVETTDAAGNTTTFVYDANGNQVEMTDANGHTYTYEYCPLNLRTRTVFPDGTFTETTYDPGCSGGRKLSETDQAGKTKRYEYDALGRLTAVVDPVGGRTSYTYDEAGNRLTQTDPNGNTTTFAYDNQGRMTQRTLPLGQSETMAYDANGNLVAKTDFNGDTTTYAYDVMNRLASRTYPDGGVVSFSYTPTGRREDVTDARGVTAHTYDGRGRLTRVDHPEGSWIAYTYDPVGNRTSVTTPHGMTEYTFDVLNRPKTVTAPGGGITRYTYDEVGNRESAAYPNGTVAEYVYDDLNRLEYVQNSKSGGEIISSYLYTLGPAGQRMRVEEEDGRVVAYTYDDLNRLVGEDIVDPARGDKTIGYAYDAFGNRLQRTVTVGGRVATTAYTYDANDRLLSEGTAVAGMALRRVHISANDASPVWQRTEPPVERYVAGYRSLLSLGALLHLVGCLGIACAVTHRRRRSGAWLASGKIFSRTLILLLAGFFLLDPTPALALNPGYFPGEAPVVAGPHDILAGEAFTYAYDANGNMIARKGEGFMDTYTYDYDNRLVQADVELGPSPGAVSYAYDSDGMRVGKTAGGATTHYLLDKNRPYAQVLAEDDGATLVTYVYGDDLISMTRPATGVSYYHYDGQMSTRQLTDAGESVTDEYAYDAFGCMLSHGGSTPNNYLYSGEQYDPNAGLYYLRARYYNQCAGRFLVQDPLSAVVSEPRSLHEYAYSMNDPTNRSDPSGNSSLVGLALVSGIVQVLTTMAWSNPSRKPKLVPIVIAGPIGSEEADPLMHDADTMIVEALARFTASELLSRGYDPIRVDEYKSNIRELLQDPNTAGFVFFGHSAGGLINVNVGGSRNLVVYGCLLGLLPASDGRLCTQELGGWNLHKMDFVSIVGCNGRTVSGAFQADWSYGGPGGFTTAQMQAVVYGLEHLP